MAVLETLTLEIKGGIAVLRGIIKWILLYLFIKKAVDGENEIWRGW